jgi:hypothetical protein
MPTPVGPAPRGPNDPDFWDWGDDDTARRQRPLRLIVIGIIVLAMVLLLVVNLL